MPNHEFENYLALVSRLLRLTRSQKDSIRDELYDHLETRISELVESGVDANTATRRALEEFGDAAVLAQRFQTVFQINQRRWMMRFATFSIAATFLAAVLIMAMWPQPARFGAPSASVAQDTAADEIAVASAETESKPDHKRRSVIWSNEDIDRKMQEPVELDYMESPFVEVMDEIRDEFGFNVRLDQTARDDSLDEETLITFNIQNARLSTALRLMLEERNATYMIQDGILRIISLDNSEDLHFFRRKMFDCRQLLENIDKHDGTVGQPMEGFGGGGGKAGGGQAGGVFNVVSEARQEETNPESGPSQPATQTESAQTDLVSALMFGSVGPVVTPQQILDRLVRTSVSPDSWDDVDGEATLVIVGGIMIVTSSQRTLDEIEILLEELNRRLK